MKNNCYRKPKIQSKKINLFPIIGYGNCPAGCPGDCCLPYETCPPWPPAYCPNSGTSCAC